MSYLNSRTTSSAPNSDDLVYLFNNAGTIDGKADVFDVFSVPQSGNSTVTFNSSQTRADIQGIINDLPRYIRKDNTLTIQFSDGTYNLDDNLNFRGFYGGGQLVIQGNTGETSGLHTNQAVHLNFNNSTFGFNFNNNCLSDIYVQYLKITTQNEQGIIAQRLSYFTIRYNYFIVTGTTSSHQGSVHLAIAQGTVQMNYFNGGYYAIRSSVDAVIDSYENDDTGTQPTFGLRANTTGTIGKRDTQPTGSTANESTANGGVIR